MGGRLSRLLTPADLRGYALGEQTGDVAFPTSNRVQIARDDRRMGQQTAQEPGVGAGTPRITVSASAARRVRSAARAGAVRDDLRQHRVVRTAHVHPGQQAGVGADRAALALLATTGTDTGYGRVALVLSMIGFGMGLAMAPATEAVMGSLPKDKAGVGSAVNDTTRQIGGALGVAILGSILSSSYGDRLVDHLAGQAPGQAVPDVALGGIGGALAFADRLPGQAGAAFADVAKESFIHGMNAAVAVGAGVAAVGAVLTMLLLPSRRGNRAEPQPPVSRLPVRQLAPMPEAAAAPVAGLVP